MSYVDQIVRTRNHSVVALAVESCQVYPSKVTISDDHHNRRWMDFMPPLFNLDPKDIAAPLPPRRIRLHGGLQIMEQDLQ